MYTIVVSHPVNCKIVSVNVRLAKSVVFLLAVKAPDQMFERLF